MMAAVSQHISEKQNHLQYPQNLACAYQVSVGSMDWHIETSGAGPVCLMLHGTGASSHSWAALVPLLAQQFQVVCVDLPGHARTQPTSQTDLSLRGMSNALNALLLQENIKPALIAGHSAGAAIMMNLCLEHTGSSLSDTCQLVSINGAVLPLGGVAGWVFSPLAKVSATNDWLPALFARRAKNLKHVQRLLESTGSTLSHENLLHYQALFTNPTHVAGVLRMMSQWHLETLKAQLPQLSQSIQLIASTNDRTIPLRDSHRLHTLLRHSALDIVDGKGHLVHEESPQQVAELILQRYNP